MRETPQTISIKDYLQQGHAIDLALRLFFQIYPKPARRALLMLRSLACIPERKSQHYDPLINEAQAAFKVYDAYKTFALKDLYSLCQSRIQLINTVLEQYLQSGQRDYAYNLAAGLVVRSFLSRPGTQPMESIEALQSLAVDVYTYPENIQPFAFYRQFPPRDLGHLMRFHVEVYTTELKQAFDHLYPDTPGDKPYLRAVS